MTLKETIDADIKSAMLSKDNVKKEILKFIKSEIQRKEGGLTIMSDVEIEKLMRNQIASLKLINRGTSEQEVEILESYLPKMLSEEEIKDVMANLQTQSDVQINTLGDIMKFFTTHYKGLVDNKLVAKHAGIHLSKL